MPRKNKSFDPQKYMKMAIDLMKESINEPRDDGKASPRVGAVLIKPDGSIDTAFRGELRYGDHAEFTVLERKNRDSKLDGSILFATLEPCAPGARSHPKLGCAERIVNARISEVWVGIEDPDPTVDRKGIKHLLDHNIKVHMFDADLQEEIRNENKEFIKQAEERAKRVNGEIQKNNLSEKDEIVNTASQSDFSTTAMEKFIRISGTPYQVNDSNFTNMFKQLGLLDMSNGSPKPTGLGLLLFGSAPHLMFPQAIVKTQFKRGTSEPDIKDFNGPLVLIPDAIETWLKDKFDKSVRRYAFQRGEEYEFPIKVLREVIINAIAHRDYDIEGANIHINIDDDKIVIKSPGAPVPPLTVAQFQNFSAPSLSRNPIIMYVFNQIKLVEQRGFGFKTLQSVPAEYGLPKPYYSYEAPYLSLTLLRSSESFNDIVGEEIIKQLNDEEKEGLLYIYNAKNITKTEYAEHFEFNDKKAQRHIAKFKKLGVIDSIGAGPSTKYSFLIG